MVSFRVAVVAVVLVLSQLAVAVPTPTLTANASTMSAPPWIHRNGIWRDRSTWQGGSEACGPVDIPSGTIYFRDSQIDLVQGAQYTPLCRNGLPVTFVISRDLPTVQTLNGTAWQSWLYHDNRGAFRESFVPILYSISASAVVCLIVNIALILFPQRPLIQIIATTVSSVHLLIVFVRATHIVSVQYHKGYVDTNSLRYDLATSTVLNALNIAFATIRLYAEVQTLMVLFYRQKEKRLVFWLGMTIVIVSQVLQGIAVFDPNAGADDSALPAFVYLFQIAISVLYFACVMYFAVTKYHATTQKDLILMTVITVLAALAPIALFVVDVGDWWAIDWNDSLSWLLNVLMVVTVWEWAKMVRAHERANEAVRVLGRQVFEDELPKDRKERKDKDNDSHGGKGNTTSGRTSAKGSDKFPLQHSQYSFSMDKASLDRGWKRALRPLTSPFLWLSDRIIEAGHTGPLEDYIKDDSLEEYPLEQLPKIHHPIRKPATIHKHTNNQ